MLLHITIGAFSLFTSYVLDTIVEVHAIFYYVLLVIYEKIPDEAPEALTNFLFVF